MRARAPLVRRTPHRQAPLRSSLAARAIEPSAGTPTARVVTWAPIVVGTPDTTTWLLTLEGLHGDGYSHLELRLRLGGNVTPLVRVVELYTFLPRILKYTYQYLSYGGENLAQQRRDPRLPNLDQPAPDVSPPDATYIEELEAAVAPDIRNTWKRCGLFFEAKNNGVIAFDTDYDQSGRLDFSPNYEIYRCASAV